MLHKIGDSLETVTKGPAPDFAGEVAQQAGLYLIHEWKWLLSGAADIRDEKGRKHGLPPELRQRLIDIEQRMVALIDASAE